MKREVTVSTAWGLGSTLILGLLILIGSRNLAHFDAALVAYTASVLFATFGLTYRYVMWLQRPPTAVYWKRGWQTFFKRGHRSRNLGSWVSHLFNDFLLNRFILARDKTRGITHLLLMWGCILAIVITFPLVFGWLHFESIPDNLELYQAYVFGFPTFVFPINSVFAFFAFHGLVWSAFIVIAGVMLAMRRRMRDEGAAALQLFAEDFLPLFFLFAVSLSGLMLTASYTWMNGYAYDFIANLHALTVIITFLWLPFGKFFHIFQRPAQLGVRFYKEVGEREETAVCRRCGHPFSSLMHITDLIQVEQELGYDYTIPGSETAHYQWICPPCRRASVAQAQSQLWQMARGGTAVFPTPAATTASPTYVNPGLGEGPLGEEDIRNFHA